MLHQWIDIVSHVNYLIFHHIGYNWMNKKYTPIFGYNVCQTFSKCINVCQLFIMLYLVHIKKDQMLLFCDVCFTDLSGFHICHNHICFCKLKVDILKGISKNLLVLFEEKINK